MEYSIHITNSETAEAKSLLQFLKTLAASQEYSFLKIEEYPTNSIDDVLRSELDARYEHFTKNKQSFIAWNDIKQNFIE